MKHPALTRVLAIVLVLLCLTMAAAGALGLTRAGKDRRSTLEEMQRLRARIEEYETVSAELADTQHQVSGMRLYAKTEEEVPLDKEYRMSGNRISVKTLDLNAEFEEIRRQLDEIVWECFGVRR